MRLVRIDRSVYPWFSLDAPIKNGSRRLRFEASVEQRIGVWIISSPISKILFPDFCSRSVLSCFHQCLDICACAAIVGQMIARKPRPGGAAIIGRISFEYVPEPALRDSLIDGQTVLDHLS